MITKKTALKLMLGLLSIVLIFHFLILFEIIPYEIVWAGKLNSVEEMRLFESISISLNIFLIIVFYIKFRNLKNNVTNKVVNFIIWVFVFLFALNSIGNLFAKSWIELVLGTSLTLISSILCWVIVRKEKSENSVE